MYKHEIEWLWPCGNNRVYSICPEVARSKVRDGLYAVFMARPAIQRRLNAAVIILLQWPILMTWIIALLTLGLFVYLVFALIKPEKF